MRTNVVMLLCAALLASFSATAQEWPSRPVKLYIPFGPGSTPDLVGRMIADRLQQKLGQPFVVEDKPGASGNLGTDAVAKAEPDGYTLGLSIAGPLAINTLLFGKLPYDPRKDFTYVTMVATQPSLLAVNARLGVSTVAELIDLLRKNPGKYNFGSIGNGSVSHLAMEADRAQERHPDRAHSLHQLTPGDDGAAARRRPDRLPAGDRHDAPACFRRGEGSRRLDGRALRAAARRSDLKESGIDVEVDTWMGLIAPAKMPDALVAKIAREVAAAITAPDIREKLSAQLMEPIPTTPAEFRDRVAADLARWAPVIKAANIRIN